MYFSKGMKSSLQRTMDLFNKPSKRLKLDLSENNENNDDFADWGGEDITAEEFDILEFQATQKVEEPPKVHLNTNSSNISVLVVNEDMKQQQYELEGKVRLLTESVDSLSKNLREERLNRDIIIEKKLCEFKEKENSLHKEVKKLESILQFKEQEMKSLYDKMNVLKTEVKVKTQQQENDEQNKFLQKFQFEPESKDIPSNMPSKVETSLLHSRMFKLQINCPKGQTQGSELISSILCNKLIRPQNTFFTPLAPKATEKSTDYTYLSAVSIADLSSQVESEELLDHFICTLNSYVAFLKNFNCRTVPSCLSTSLLNSPSLLKRDVNIEQNTALQALKDLTFFISSHQFSVLSKKIMPETCDKEPSSSKCMSPSHLADKLNALLKSLLSFLNQNPFSNAYPKRDEMELTLAVLLSWSTAVPESLIPFAAELPFKDLFKATSSVTALRMTLQLLTNLCVHEETSHLFSHQNDWCLTCNSASVTLQKVIGFPLDSIPLMLALESYLSTFLTLYSFTEIKLECSPCLTVILHGNISALLRYVSFVNKSDEVAELLKKGFCLLHLLSRVTPGFKDRRSDSEDEYISLVCAMLTLSKENIHFRDFLDIAHDLWDFQEDVSEFDLEDSPEDSS